MRDIVKLIEHPNGARRLEILRNSDGTFTFEEFAFDETENVFCPLPSRGRSLSRTASLHEALAEARGRVEWLSEIGL